MTTPIVYDYAAIAAAMKPDDPICSKCEGGGWIGEFGPQGQGPNFRECDKCDNPDEIPQP